ncbi:MAG: DUF5723 family protein [Crocinitomicaceae bacterium]|nr:DUF5723 family protein [Crocinitomicaceae bacterium]
MIKFIACIAFLGSLSSVFGQNAFGTLHGNYTPTNSVYVNPSSMLDAKVWLDINIVGAGSYTNNNLVYLEDQSWFSLLRDLNQVRKGELTEDRLPNENDIGFNQNRRFYHMYNRNFVTGPSAVWSQGDHAAGLAFGVRSYTSVRRVPSYVGQFIENGVPDFTQQHDVDYSLNNLRVASLQFGEIKGSYAYTFLKRRRDMFMGGISISKFISVAGAAATVSQLDFNVDNDSLALLYDVQADGMYTPNPRMNWKGGMGLDLGFTYQKMLNEAGSYYPNSPKLGCRDVPYLYKLGLSIIDIGSIKFDEEDIQYAGYDFDNYSWEDYPTEQVDEDNPLNIFQAQEANINEGQIRKPNKIRLPTFISAQFDYNVWASRFYVNATLIQGLPIGKRKFGIRHANSLSVTPRFETYWFEASLPISLYEYQYPQLGLSLRLGPLSIGTDKLGHWIKRSNLYGADIYFHLKIPLRYHPKCRGRVKGIKSKNGQRHKKYVPCDAYG